MRIHTTVVAALLFASAPAALADSNAQKAEAFNSEGKALFKGKNYTDAVAKFRRAAMWKPEARYYFNWCYAAYKAKDHLSAKEACTAVSAHKPSATLVKKTDQLLVLIQKALDKGGTKPPPTTGTPPTDPATGDPTTPPTGDPTTDPGTDPATDPSGTEPPATDPGGYADGADAGDPADVTGSTISENYKWGVGIDLGAVNSSLGGDDLYASGGTYVRLAANFLTFPSKKLGIQTYLGFTDIGTNTLSERLNIVDIGAALYYHHNLTDRLIFTPQAGAHIAILQPESLGGGDSFLSLGLHASAGVDYVFGSKRQHAVNASLTMNFYLPSSDTSSTFPPEFYGLDELGRTMGFTIGYRHRFSTPFGTTPIFTLE